MYLIEATMVNNSKFDSVEKFRNDMIANAGMYLNEATMVT